MDVSKALSRPANPLLTSFVNYSLRPIPPRLTVAAADILLPSAGQADLPLCGIRSPRWVQTPSKHSHAWPAPRSFLTVQLYPERLWSCFLAVDVDRSGSISVHELRK